MDFEKYYRGIKLLLNLGFDLDKNTARDFLYAAKDVYDNYEEYVEELSNSSFNSQFSE